MKGDQGRNKGIKEEYNLTWTNYLTDSQAEEGGEAEGDKGSYIMSV